MLPFPPLLSYISPPFLSPLPYPSLLTIIFLPSLLFLPVFHPFPNLLHNILISIFLLPTWSPDLNVPESKNSIIESVFWLPNVFIGQPNIFFEPKLVFLGPQMTYLVIQVTSLGI